MFQTFLNLPLDEIPENLKLAGTAIYVSDLLNKQNIFWRIVLNRPTPSSFNASGGVAVRQFVEIVLANLGPFEIMRRITPVLLDPTKSWDALGLISINDEFIGSPLTEQMKLDLIEILNESAKIFLEGIIKDLLILTENIEFSYGYGYSINDIKKENYGYGFGASYDPLNYFDLLVMLS